MALKPIIFKVGFDLSDLNRDYYQSFNLTIAQHPSETAQRMMVRLLVYALNASESLSFTRGISSPEEPDIWDKALDGQIKNWIEVGEPDADRVRKACGLAEKVSVYSFNRKAPVWWQQSFEKFSDLNASVYRFKWEQVDALKLFVARNMHFSITLSEETIYLVSGDQSLELDVIALQ